MHRNFRFILHFMRDTIIHPCPHLERQFIEKDCMKKVKSHIRKDVPENSVYK